MDERSAPRWAAVFSLALGVFGLVTAEFLPVSLLTDMAHDLHISDGAAGQAITATALVAAVAAPSLPLLTRNVDRRLVMLAYTVLLIASNALSAVATGWPMLLTARVLLGIALGGFWSMSGALTLRLLFARGLAMLMMGVSLATVVAAPLGAWMGSVWGWRSAFMLAGVISLVTLAGQLLALPPLPPRDKPNLRVLGELLRRPPVRAGLLVVLLIVAGHFAGFTYVRPFMEQVTHLPVAAVSGVLLAYGVAGFFGNVAAGWLVARGPRLAIYSAAGLIVLMALALVLAGQHPALAVVAITVWGFSFVILPVAFQTWLIQAAPDHTEGVGGLFVCAFQVAIASGALGGGLLVDHIGARGGPAIALVAMALGIALTWRFGPKARSPQHMAPVATAH